MRSHLRSAADPGEAYIVVKGPECFREIPNRAGPTPACGLQMLQHMPGLCLLEGMGVEPSAADPPTLTLSSAQGRGRFWGNPYIGAAYTDPKVARYWSTCRVLVCWKA
jgi:hypothetical protein